MSIKKPIINYIYTYPQKKLYLYMQGNTILQFPAKVVRSTRKWTCNFTYMDLFIRTRTHQ